MKQKKNERERERERERGGYLDLSMRERAQRETERVCVRVIADERQRETWSNYCQQKLKDLFGEVLFTGHHNYSA